jgi:two-component system, OmpR family, sensor kinase
MTLRLRLGIGIAVIIALSLSVLGFAVVTTTRNDLQRSVRVQLEGALTNRVNAPPPPVNRSGDRAVRDPAQRPTPTPAPNLPPGAAAAAGSVSVGARDTIDPRGVATAHLVIDPDGTISVGEPAGPPSNPSPLPQLDTSAIAALRDGRAVTASSGDGRLRYLMVGANISDGRLEVEAAPLDTLDRTVSSLKRRLAVGALLTLLIATLAVLVVVRNGLRPLLGVIDTADAVAAGEREQRIATNTGPTEIRQLSVALDHMLQNQRASLVALEDSEARLRRFIADASHELQTPITSILGWTQLLRKGALDEPAATAAMERIESEGHRMSVLVDDLLLLAQLDEHRPLQWQSCDLSAIAREAVVNAQVVSPDRPLSIDAPTPVIVNGDSARLRQVIDNLLRNVRVHTPAGSAASVTVRATSGPTGIVAAGTGGAIVHVRDHGPGIDSDAVPNIFDRFWRRDPSRTRATGGAGLGLAIVAALVHAHDGTVTVANHCDGGAVFTVSLPGVSSCVTPAAAPSPQ